MKILGALGLVLGFLVLPTGCSGGGSSGGSGNIPSTGQETVFAITANNRLISFDPGATDSLLSKRKVTGLVPGEELVAIDYRPGTGQLYGLGATSRIYTIDTATGVATEVGAGPFAPALAGLDFGFDFNPVVDRIRAVSDADENLRLHPDTGVVAGVDTALAYDAGDLNSGIDPMVVASAYTNGFSGAVSTTLFALDAGLDVLVTQGSPGGSPVSPNDGTLFTVGPLGTDMSGEAGLDISSFGGAFACLTAPASATSELYTINLTTGAATLLGTIGGSSAVRDIAIVPPAAPRVFALTTTNNLVSFRPASPGTLLDTVAVSGLQIGEDVLGIDFRPATGELFGLGDTSRVYTIDKESGVATEVGVGPFAPLLSGTDFGVDFNPVPDRLRVVSDADQNLRLNPASGAVAATDTDLTYDPLDPNAAADPAVVASAYTNNLPGSGSTTLFGIDSDLDNLVRQGSPDGTPLSPNGGVLFTIGTGLGVDTSGLAGLDVSTFGGTLASLTAPAGVDSQLHSVNLTTGATTLIGTIGGGETVRGIAIEAPSRPILYAATSANELISFLAGTPNTIVSSVSITGLQSAETVVALDFRPATRELIALGSSSRLYTLDRTTGAANDIGTGSFAPALAGAEFGMDFNPSADRIRVVSDADQNLRLNPVTGAVASADGTLAYDVGDPNAGQDPSIIAVAYDANFSGTTSTTLFGVDSALDILVTQGSPGGAPISSNLGTLFSVGALGIDASQVVGFDVSTLGGAFAAITAPAAIDSQLYSINLTTGAATLIGTIGGPQTIRGLAMLPSGL